MSKFYCFWLAVLSVLTAWQIVLFVQEPTMGNALWALICGGMVILEIEDALADDDEDDWP